MNMKPDTIRLGLFRDRREAGRLLAAKLANYADRPDIVVLALPRGGVPVAYEVASALDLPLDVFVVRKPIAALRQLQPARIVVAVRRHRPKSARRSARRSTMSFAPLRQSRSTLWTSGTKISRRRRTRRFTTCSRSEHIKKC
jgi:hypothetical protein